MQKPGSPHISKNPGAAQRRAQHPHTTALPQPQPTCCLLTCEAGIQVDDEGVVVPVKGHQQVEEAQEPNLGRAADKTKNSSTLAFAPPAWQLGRNRVWE